MARNYSRTPPPRPLGAHETLESLSHWQTTFRTFYKKDDSYKIFFKKDQKWNYLRQNYDLQDETDGDKRTASELAEDLADLLNTLAGYLPHSYLTDKILKSSSCWADVWRIIHDHYNVQVTSETLLDFESLHKLSEETHRQFYERLLQHAKQHLAPANVKVENFTNSQPDTMSISLMNFVALQWLRKVDPTLIAIVKTEYSTELRSNVQLADLVPRIAPNIDSLLKRYDVGSNTNKINVKEDDETVDASTATVSKTWGRGGFQNQSSRGRGGPTPGPGRGRGQSARGRGGQYQTRGQGPFCPGCYYLSQQLGTTIHFRHTPGDCPRKAVAIKMFKMEDAECFGDEFEEDDSVIVGKITTEPKEENYDNQFQTSRTNLPDLLHQESFPQSSFEFHRPADTLVETDHVQNPNIDASRKELSVIISDTKMNPTYVRSLEMKVLKLNERKSNWLDTGVRKSKSPCLAVTLNNRPTFATIDEGSEINCLDYGFATQNGIKFSPTDCVATAAGSTAMNLSGETIDGISISISDSKTPIIVTLGKMVVVRNLGVDILIGEPGKVYNEIVTIPHRRLIEMNDVNKNRVKLQYSSKSKNLYNPSFVCKSIKSETIYPNQAINIKLPVHLRNLSQVTVATKNSKLYPWVKTKNVIVDRTGAVDIVNEDDNPVKLSKHEQFASVTATIEVPMEDMKNENYTRKIYDINREDISHLIPHKIPDDKNDDKEDYLDEISVDPDNILSSAWKQRFLSICKEYSHIITPRPGKYNGFYGRIDNSINFSASPPPSIRAHLPKYNHDMLKIMGEKMDRLEEWGVLKKPEEIGVVPEFVVPSMLMPKSEKGEWRLVTDFTALNTHIKKLQTVAPTTKEAKGKLAKYKYHIQLDLSNYFYQGGMNIEDCQYLATPHPFKGLRVYTCEPQGLKNASEHSYERLGLVYGDMCGEEKITRMADGLYVLADTLEELEKNFIEVLARAELCGFTFKPSKVIIAPHETIIFGWKKVGNGWTPTSHVVSPLIKANPPTTVKQTRSWIGSYKQLTDCIPRYAALLGPLEDVLGGRGSAERINWTESLLTTFNKCKKSLNDIKEVFIPKPSDILHTYSDYSAAEKAVGGRLEIHREEDGKVKRFMGGHFSCRVNKHQQHWHPCEGEALAVRLVLEHFSHFIIENKNQCIHHTDNQPVVQAWRRSKTGAFSASARIAAFLSGVSAMNIEIIHTPGTEMKSSDYNSRHPEDCTERQCQICRFAYEMEMIGDKVAKITVDDIEKGSANMPFNQRSAWIKVQKNDKVHQQLAFLINTSQSPERRKTKGDNTILKRLHNLYKKGQLKMAADGLITVSQVDPKYGTYQAISVPSQMFPGLVQAIHLKLGHPSKLQLMKLLSRYFYSPGYARVVEEVTSNCVVCSSLKQLPEQLFSESTVETSTFGANFSSDVIRMHGQKILLTREKLSQFTMTILVKDETADSLRTALVTQILEFIPSSGALVQVDCAPAFQSLKTESDAEGSILKKLGIKVNLGRTLNKNKNPIAENAIKEFHKEKLRLNPQGGSVTELELAIITKNINSRIRHRGLSAKEIVFQREQVTNNAKPVSDEALAKEQVEKREKQHNPVSNHSQHKFAVGNNVFLKNDRSKLRGREMYKVIELFLKNDESWAKIQKAETQFRAKTYEVKTEEIYLVPGDSLNFNHDEEITTNEDKVIMKKDAHTQTAELKVQHEDNNCEAEDDTINHNGSEVSEANPTLNYDLENNTTNDENVEVPTPATNIRGRRKAAIKSSNQFKTLISEGLLMVNVPAKQLKPPSHAWDWNDFLYLYNMEDACFVGDAAPSPTAAMAEDVQELEESIFDMNVSVMNNLVNTMSAKKSDTNENIFEDYEEYWDNSPEQYELTGHDDKEIHPYPEEEEYVDPIFHSTKLFSSPDHSENSVPTRSHETLPQDTPISDPENLTSEDSDDEVFFNDENRPITRSHLQRRNAFRKKKHHRTGSLHINTGELNVHIPKPNPISLPSSPSRVKNNLKQNLSLVLPIRNPVVPEAVNLNDGAVQLLGQALDSLYNEAHVRGQQEDQHLHEDQPRLRPRQPINYDDFHKFGRK